MTAFHVHGGHVLAGEAVLPAARIEVAAGRIVAIAAPDPADGPADVTIDLAGGWLLPGFIDTQVNGGGGVLFNDNPSVDSIAAIGAAHARFGTTGFLPTLISDAPEAIAGALDAVDVAIAAGVPGVLGIHIEGPFINAARKGIHDADKLRQLDPETIDILMRPRAGRVMLTLAPERVDPADLARLAPHVLLSAGHSDADYETATAAFAQGVRGATHLFNAMSPFTHRAPGLVGAVLDDDAVWCGIIADGVHAVPAALRLALRVKGPDRLMLVTDAMPNVGNGDTPFMLDGRQITVRDGICRDAAGTLAGSGLDMARALRNIIAATGAPVADAARMAAATPAAFLGLGSERGTLAVGLRADFVVLDAGLNPVQTWCGGEALPAPDATRPI